ncbi:restriction endonuclease subunit S [Algoriphagus formosus]|uniref:restriction endonuclease subunit S n=1 Tax=Algoriphagus formosus TaxID=2007308 RepID=UPI003F6F2EAE
MEPELRFKEFNGDWNNTLLEKSVSLISGQHLKPEEYHNSREKGNIPYFSGPSDFTNNLENVTKWSKKTKNCGNKGDILITVKGSGVGSMFLLNQESVAIGRQLMAIKSKKSSNIFIYNFLLLRENQFKSLASGNLIPGLSRFDILSLNFCHPLIGEQQKIASFLSLVDQKITKLKEKKELLEQYKKGVMQQLFSQELRFKDENGEEFPDWEEVQLNDVLFEHKSKNKKDEYDEVFSVAKHKGVINQIEHLGRSFSAASISHYKLIFPGDIVYTKSPTSEFPFGIIKQNQTERTGVVSPLYGVFTPDSPELGLILHEYFLSPINTYNYLNPLVQKGAKNTMNINNDTFLNGAQIALPLDKEEQKRIANFITTFNEKLEQLENQILNLETWKKGLLQQMFV